MKYIQRKDGEGWEEIAEEPFRIACCDCGLVHDIVVVVRGKGKEIGIAAARNNRATAQRRRRLFSANRLIDEMQRKQK
jgi:hypothetical protein